MRLQQRSLTSVLTIIPLFLGMGCGQTPPQANPDLRVFDASSIPTVVTRSSGPKLDSETVEKIRSAKAVLHRFSNGRVIRVFNDHGDAVDVGGHIVVSRFDQLVEEIEGYEQHLATPRTEDSKPLNIIEDDSSKEEVQTLGVGVKPNVCVPSILDGVCLWQSGVPYTFDSSINAAGIAKIQNAINIWNASSVGIKFRPMITTNEPFVRFRIANTCSSYVGRYQSAGANGFAGQNINVANLPYCIDTPRSLLHEMGHAAGLWHEQQRCDRDNFLVVSSSDDLSYGKRCESNVAQYDKFDFDSVMLYGLGTYTDGSSIALSPNLPAFPSSAYNGNPANVASGTALSAGDRSALDQAYQLPVPVSSAVVEAHGAGYGWQSWQGNNTIAGTVGQGRRVEALRLSVKNIRSGLGVSYSTHVSGFGWLPAVSDAGVAGTTGLSKPVEAFQVVLTGNRSGCSISYRAHVASIGWLGWVAEGSVGGTTGQNRQLEALQVNVVCN